jgi:hypothetical protein
MRFRETTYVFLFMCMVDFTWGELRKPQHLIFMGDSLMRYGFLEWLFQYHYGVHSSKVPHAMIYNDGGTYRQKWESFYHFTTNAFGGSMICDCFRGPIMGRSEDIFELRYYKNESNHFHATYLQQFGDAPVQGKINIAEAKIYSNLGDAHRNIWSYNFVEIFEHFKTLKEPPTAIFMNQKFWCVPYRKSSKYFQNIRAIIAAALQVTGNVIWMEGTPDFSELRDNVYITGANHRMQLLMKNEICNRNSSRSVEVKVGNESRVCKFAEFPRQVLATLNLSVDFETGDPFHLQNASHYAARVSEALRVAGFAFLMTE